MKVKKFQGGNSNGLIVGASGEGIDSFVGDDSGNNRPVEEGNGGGILIPSIDIEGIEKFKRMGYEVIENNGDILVRKIGYKEIPPKSKHKGKKFVALALAASIALGGALYHIKNTFSTQFNQLSKDVKKIEQTVDKQYTTIDKKFEDLNSKYSKQIEGQSKVIGNLQQTVQSIEPDEKKYDKNNNFVDKELPAKIAKSVYTISTISIFDFKHGEQQGWWYEFIGGDRFRIEKGQGSMFRLGNVIVSAYHILPDELIEYSPIYGEVVLDAKKLGEMAWVEYEGKVYELKLLEKDGKIDYAIFEIPDGLRGVLTPLPCDIGDSDEIEIGQFVHTAERPIGLSSNLKAGYVSSTDFDLSKITGKSDLSKDNVFIVTNQPSPGGSGGAAIMYNNGRCYVTGMNMGYVTFTSNMGIIVRINNIIEKAGILIDPFMYNPF